MQWPQRDREDDRKDDERGEVQTREVAQLSRQE